MYNQLDNNISPSERMKLIKSRKDKEIEIVPNQKLHQFDLKPSGNGSFQFIPEFIASVQPSKTISFSGKCFKKYTASLKFLNANDTDAELYLEASDHDGLLPCYDLFLLANLETFYVKAIILEGKHTIRLSGLKQQEILDLIENGMNVFMIQGHIVKTLEDIYDTYVLFKGTWDLKGSLEFLQDHMNITYQNRTAGYFNVTEDDIPSGTYLATQRFDGSEVMIQYGTGSYSGHSTVAVRLNGTLHVCESNGKNSPAYWPPPYGVVCHPYQVWMSLAIQAGYSVTLMPLRKDLQSLYNEAKAQSFIQSRLGLPYGFHNFIYGFIDTLDGNYPPPISEQFLTVGFSLFDVLKPATAQSIWIDGLNFRLGLNCSDMNCVIDFLEKKNMSLIEALIIPEQDSWVYPDGYSMVCDVFVLEVYKAAGVFGDIVFQATEFTPKDLYTLQIFDSSPKISGCPGAQTPNQFVCQIMGQYWMQFPDWNTVAPYNNMCERCESKWPLYQRLPKNC